MVRRRKLVELDEALDRVSAEANKILSDWDPEHPGRALADAFQDLDWAIDREGDIPEFWKQAIQKRTPGD